MRGAIVFFLVVGVATLARAQITINPDDMFNEVGLYYKAYANDYDPLTQEGTVTVSDVIGDPGRDQLWDFTEGPEEVELRFDYIEPDADGTGGDFPEADFAERKTDQSDGSQAYLFLSQEPGQGRVNYGFYDPTFSSTQPSSPFDPPVTDFPERIQFGDTWTYDTRFETEISMQGLSVPAIIHLTAEATVDASGLIELPELGFEDCLRVNEVTEWVIDVDLQGDGTFQTVETQYVRNYYWLTDDRGIAAQITSRQRGTPPPDNFSVATQFVRMFETNKPRNDDEEPEPSDFTVSLTKQDGEVLLKWSEVAAAESYRVEWSADAGDPTSWSELTVTSGTFAVDSSIQGTSARFYRVTPVEE